MLLMLMYAGIIVDEKFGVKCRLVEARLVDTWYSQICSPILVTVKINGEKQVISVYWSHNRTIFA